MESFELIADVHLPGVEDAARKAAELTEKIKEAKTLAGELASLMGKLEVKVEM